MESSHISSPPKPSRLSRMELPAAVSNSPTHQMTTQFPCVKSLAGMQQLAANVDLAADFEGQMVERTVSSILPQVMSEVFSAQQGQADEIHKQKSILAAFKLDAAKEEEMNSEQKQETLAVTNRVYRSEERAIELRQTLKHLATDIQSVVCQKHNLQLAVSRLEDDVQSQQRRFKKYKDKTFAFCEKTMDYEKQHSTSFIQLQEVIESVNKLKPKMFDGVCDEEWSSKEKELSSNIERLKTKLKDTETGNRDLEAKIHEEEGSQENIEHSIYVLQKRNAAQLKRIKTQRKDMDVRIRQKQSQMTRLKENLQRASDMLEA